MVFDPRRRATAFTVTVLCLLIAARITDVLANGWSPEVPFTLALFAVPMLYAVPASRRLLDRHRWALLAIQSVLTYLPFAYFGRHWQIGIDGLLAGLVLLTVRGRLGWAIASLLLLAEVAVRAAITGMPYAMPSVVNGASVISYYVDDALILFGIVRLSQIVAETEEAGVQGAQLAMATERLRAAESLQAAVGKRLGEIASNAAAAQAALLSDVAEVRARVRAAGVVAREAARNARAIPAAWPTVHAYAAQPDGPAAIIGVRVAWLVVVTVLVMFSVGDGGIVLILPLGARRTALVIGGMVLTAGLQLYHSRAASQDRRPRYWPITLAIQALLVYSFLFPFIWAYNGELSPFLAGSILLLVPGAWRWVGYGLVVVSYSVLTVVLPLVGNNIIFGTDPQLPLVLNGAVEIALVGLLVYGLSRLAALARRLEVLRGQLAETAAVQEQLRVARDVHDLLGLGLSAIALKSDLAAKLIDRDQARAAGEIQDLNRICAAAMADIRLVTEDAARPRLRDELQAAKEILQSAGIQVRDVALNGALPPEADEVLVPVLREGITNVLRHSKATVCIIEIIATDRLWTLQVSNDGIEQQSVWSRESRGRSGRGMANLAARIGSVGGQVQSHRADGWFVLVAQVPMRSTKLHGRDDGRVSLS